MFKQIEDMPIMSHELKIDGVTVYQDFNCRFTTEGYILFVTIVATRGCFTLVV